MDFHQLLTKMQELDKPSVESTTEMGCSSPSPMPAVPPAPEIPPPSMSVNLNAQGLDNIESMMKLFQKVNPDMMPKAEPMPSLSMEPPIASIKPSLPPLKMLPDLSDEPAPELDKKPEMMDKPDDSDDGVSKAQGDLDNDGDHDMDDHDLEKKKDKEEAYANEPDEDEKDIDYMNNKLAGGMNRPKDTFPKVSDGDNPMQKKKFESGDLRAQIRAELLQRLSEAKGAK